MRPVVGEENLRKSMAAEYYYNEERGSSLSCDIAGGFCFNSFAKMIDRDNYEAVPGAGVKEGTNYVNTNGVEGILGNNEFNPICQGSGAL